MKSKLKIVLVFALTMFLIQHITFKVIGVPSLKNKILIDFNSDEHVINGKAFVRGYYTTDCSVGDPTNHYSLELESESDFIKRKLKMDSIHFGNIKTSDWSDTTVSNYDIYYEAYVTSNSIGSLYSFYQCNLVEDIYYPKDFNFDKSYHKNTNYRWLFFFWI